MKTGKESKPQGQSHRQQLFYWTGRSIDDLNGRRKVLRDDLVAKVIGQLTGSLEHGLWVKTPRYPETLESRGSYFAFDLPIACFTEWSLGESLPHTMEYGRMGFGFPKSWVIARGGQSVTYFRHDQRGSFLSAMFRLLRLHADEQPDGTWVAKSGNTGFADLKYVIHFAKMIRLRKQIGASKDRSAVALPTDSSPAKRKRKITPAGLDAQTYRRKFGHPLQFVEEREWRIVYHSVNQGFVKGPGVPDYYLPYIPGDELFTLVLPDNKVVSRVLQSDWLTDRLFFPWKHYPVLKGRRVPPVTLLSHSDLGTF
jgi:hypothetical protein